VAVVHLARGRSRRIQAGHPWVFRTEVESVHGHADPGDIVDVVDHRGKFLGRGYINPASQILVRLLTTHEETVDAAFIQRRLRTAWEYRRRLLPDVEACRVVFGEADFVPGLIVDKFGPVLVVQTLALGIDKWRDEIVGMLQELLSPDGIYERNDARVRELEGLPLRTGVLQGHVPDRITVAENGLQVHVDVVGGQKTGYFLDQRENRAAIRPLCRGARVLDAFCHTGGFALNACAGDARSVLALDISAEALAVVGENAALNGMADRITTRAGNAFDALREMQQAREQFDVVVLDPPAFAKNKAALEGAARGYKEINLRALKLLAPGGFLVTCSCSYHMDPALFKAVVEDAAVDARRRLRLLAQRAQGVDHPILIGYDESHYLKCLIYEVI